MSGTGNYIAAMLALAAATVFLMGFTPQPELVGKQAPGEKCKTQWVLTPAPTDKDGFFGVGMAEKGPNPKQTADHRAINEAIRAAQTKTDHGMQKIMENTAIGDIKALSEISKKNLEFEKKSRSRCKIVKREVCPDGTYISLAILPNARYLKKLNQQLKKRGAPSQKKAVDFEKFKADEKAEFESFKSKQPAEN